VIKHLACTPAPSLQPYTDASIASRFQTQITQHNMPSALSSWTACLCCFPRRKRAQRLNGVSPWIATDPDAKAPHTSSQSVDSSQTLSATPSLSPVEEKVLESKGQVIAQTTALSSPTDQSIFALQQPTAETPTNSALLVTAKGEYTLSDSFDYPSIQSPNEVVIRSHAVGLNPIDWKSVDYGFCLPSFPWITGREMAGVVHEVGSEVTGLNVGDLVWTSELSSTATPYTSDRHDNTKADMKSFLPGTYYRDRRAGCFQNYVTVPSHTVLPLPPNLSLEQAATLGVAGLTAAMTLWHWLDVPMPSTTAPTPTTATQPPTQQNPYLLLWGGATTTGQYLIQLCALAGIPTIVIASTRTQAQCLALGATHVIARDGKSPANLLAAIASARGSGRKITRVVDLVGPKTAELCLQAVRDASVDSEKEKEEGKREEKERIRFAPLAMIDAAVAAGAESHVEILTVEMKRFVLDPSCAVYARVLNALVASEQVKVPAVEVLEGGLAAVQSGLERVKKGDTGGRKLVVRF
jgi:NADPH:quinone reductase-like Zn-dependent oxidoreductase